MDFTALAQRYEKTKPIGEYMMKIKTEKFELSLFKDGRLIVHGTNDPNRAISLYSEYVGR